MSDIEFLRIVTGGYPIIGRTDTVGFQVGDNYIYVMLDRRDTINA